MYLYLYLYIFLHLYMDQRIKYLLSISQVRFIVVVSGDLRWRQVVASCQHPVAHLVFHLLFLSGFQFFTAINVQKERKQIVASCQHLVAHLVNNDLKFCLVFARFQGGFC